MISTGQSAGIANRVRTEPRCACCTRAGSRTSTRIASATSAVTAASAQTVPRQPKASTAADRGSEAAMLPRLPMPMTMPASVPKTAAENCRAKM